MTRTSDYLKENIVLAIKCLCLEGSFKNRFEDACGTALLRLKNDDLKGEYSEDLKYVLRECSKMKNGTFEHNFNEETIGKITENLIGILIETIRMQPH